MRLLIQLDHLPNRRLSFNYPYHLSSWIYHTLGQSDGPFAQWLHEKGFGYGVRSYKLFTFGPLQPTEYRIDRRRRHFIAVRPPTQLVLSFWLERAVQDFVMGLFENQTFTLGDRDTQATFHVCSVEMQHEPDFQPTMRYRTTSPLCLTRNVPGKRHPQYMEPDDEHFGSYLLHNLLRKQRAIAGVPAGTYGPDDWPEAPENYRFRLLTPPDRIRSKMVEVKGIKLRGHLFDFELTLPPELHRLGYHAGFGEKNSAVGMGLVEVAAINMN